jgi:uncharacterized repeat protein (TIGR03803 family)
LYSFSGKNDGGNPETGLMQGGDGNFYGTTSDGGTSNIGTVFKISANGALTSLYSFTGTNDGANPQAGLVQGTDGYSYGTTRSGGASNYGTVFKITPNAAYTSLYSFTGTNDGANPQAGLVRGSDGYFYGTTSDEYSLGSGTVFKITTNGALTTLYAFGSITNAKGYSLDGAHPYAGLLQASDGYFYGTTYSGGMSNFGTVFKISTNGALTTLYAFGKITYDGYSLDGANPYARLVQGSDGSFYGTTYNGGAYYGTVFKIRTDGAYSSLISFGGFDGANPSAGLVQGTDGNLYGTTQNGGQGASGTIFRLTIVPEVQSMNLTNSTLSLNWSTEAGATYQLQYNSNLGSSNWTNLRSPVTSAGGALSTTDSVTNGPQRFYRLVVSP